jgi:shikimate dehydrogenase
VSSTAEPRAPVPPGALVLLGHPVAHSLSPTFQQAALDQAHLAVRYRAHDTATAQFAATLAECAAQRVAGNVTIPHKERMFDACDRHTAMAQRVRAVNTFWHDEDGRLVGHNTDVIGALAAMRAVLAAQPHGVDPHRGATQTEDVRRGAAHRERAPGEGLHVALLGAGGSAASVLVALEQLPVEEVRIWSRTSARAEGLAERTTLPVRVCNTAAQAVARARLVVNTTPIGLADDHQPVPAESLAHDAAVLDLVYRRGETPWVHACRARGHRAEDGLRMLVEQGAAAFSCWFGREPDREAMWRVLEPRPFGV